MNKKKLFKNFFGIYLGVLEVMGWVYINIKGESIVKIQNIHHKNIEPTQSHKQQQMASHKSMKMS